VSKGYKILIPYCLPLIESVEPFKGYGTNLLRVQGFDQNTGQYSYSVESGVGVKPINGILWRLQLGARYSF
jgi:hypothetical protein